MSRWNYSVVILDLSSLPGSKPKIITADSGMTDYDAVPEPTAPPAEQTSDSSKLGS